MTPEMRREMQDEMRRGEARLVAQSPVIRAEIMRRVLHRIQARKE
jgi:hypothetical protein